MTRIAAVDLPPGGPEVRRELQSQLLLVRCVGEAGSTPTALAVVVGDEVLSLPVQDMRRVIWLGQRQHLAAGRYERVDRVLRLAGTVAALLEPPRVDAAEQALQLVSSDQVLELPLCAVVEALEGDGVARDWGPPLVAVH